jgi:hypothetical protein
MTHAINFFTINEGLIFVSYFVAELLLHCIKKAPGNALYYEIKTALLFI